MVKKAHSGKSPRILELNKVYQGNSLDVLKTFPDESLDMCITSPPYWGLRDYGTDGQIWGGDEKCKHDFDKSKRILHTGTWSKDGESNVLPHYKNATKLHWEVEDAICNKCGAWEGELGLEPTPEMFVNHLCDIFDEVKRCLRPHGTCWVNLGDTYANSGYGKGTGNMQNVNVPGAMTPKIKCDLPQKCLVQIPSKFAIEMVDRGWILRNEIIWHKPSCMPSPATDRFTVDFEKLFFFTKNKKYYFKQQLEPIKEISLKRAEYGWDGTHATGRSCNPEKGVKMGERWANPNGRNKRTVWSINTASFKGAHFAVYPPELIESPIDAGCPEYVDKKTGKPRERVIEKKSLERYELPEDNPNYRPARYKGKYDTLHGGNTGQKFAVYNDKGYDDGRDSSEFTPGVVLDPFFGSGTTAEVAMKQGKDWVGIDLNDEYIGISEKRLEPTIKEKKTRDKASEFWE